MKLPRWFRRHRRFPRGGWVTTPEPANTRGSDSVSVTLAPAETWCQDCGAGYITPRTVVAQGKHLDPDRVRHALSTTGWQVRHRTVCDPTALEGRLGAPAFESLCRTTPRRAEGSIPPPSEAEITAFIAARRAAGGHLPEGAR